MNIRFLRNAGLVLAMGLAVPVGAWAARVEAPTEVTVQFGQFAFPQDPAPLNHFLDPDEVTIQKGGSVTFEINGINHGVAIYPVSMGTTREDIEAGLCQPDPATCNPQGATTGNMEYFVFDASGEQIIDTGTNPPSNRVNDPTQRLIYTGGPVVLTGRTAADSPAQQIQYRFEKVGRYLVICSQRTHFINDRMFGFVNVVRRYLKDAEE